MADSIQLSGFSVFSGVGMLDEAIKLDLALRGVEYRTAAFCEWETGAASTLLARMEEQSLERCPVWGGDLRDLPAELFAGRINIFSAGYPCQPFSCAGLQRGLEDERAMGEDGGGPIAGMLGIIGAIKPGLVFLENVPQALKHFRPIGRELERMGYEVAPPLILAAEDAGANHKRERMFILCKLANGNERGFGGIRESGSRESGNHSDDSFEELANSESGRQRECGKSSGCDRQSDGSNEELAHSSGQRRQQISRSSFGDEEADEGRREIHSDESECGIETVADTDCRRCPGSEQRKDQQSRRSETLGASEKLENSPRSLQRKQRSGRKRTGSTVQELGDSASERRSTGSINNGEATGVGQEPEPRAGTGSGCTEMAESRIDGGEAGVSGSISGEEGNAGITLHSGPERIFAPGPGDRSEWERTLSDCPHLAPAIEPEIRVLVDGVAYVVDSSRADQLRCCGNGVVAIQGAIAFELLLREFGI